MKKNLGVRSNVKGRRVFQTKKDDSRLTPRARRRARRASLLATRASRHEGMPFWVVTSGGGGDGPGPFDPPLARDVRERYTCALCLDLFKDPLYLHDAHAFCARCLLQLSGRLGRNFACPLCRRRCDVVKALPADDLAGALEEALVAVSRDDFLSGPAPDMILIIISFYLLIRSLATTSCQVQRQGSAAATSVTPCHTQPPCLRRGRGRGRTIGRAGFSGRTQPTLLVAHRRRGESSHTGASVARRFADGLLGGAGYSSWAHRA